MDTRLRNLLHDLASEMPVELERSAPPTLRKARRRRAVGAAGAVVAVVAFVAVGVSALRMVSEPTVPAATGPNPATFAGLWPETSPEALETAQEAADDGHQPLRTTPDGTATMLATDLLGWAPGDVRIDRVARDTHEATVAISNRILRDDIVCEPAIWCQGMPPITVELRQLGETGQNSIWSVVGVSTPLIDLDPVAGGSSGTLRVSGRVADGGSGQIEGLVLDGPSEDDAQAGFAVAIEEAAFETAVAVAATPDGQATLLVTVPGTNGASLGAVMVPVQTPLGEPETSGPNLTGVPPDVAATAQEIYDAAKAKDFAALAELLDPNTFIYNMSDGSNPIPEWRDDPFLLDVMVAILEMPPTTRDIGPGYGTFYFWPYLVNSDFENLTPQERADLAALGYTDEEIRMMAEFGYQGPRLAIDENGEWRNFITAGE